MDARELQRIKTRAESRFWYFKLALSLGMLWGVVGGAITWGISVNLLTAASFLGIAGVLAAAYIPVVVILAAAILYTGYTAYERYGIYQANVKNQQKTAQSKLDQLPKGNPPGRNLDHQETKNKSHSPDQRLKQDEENELTSSTLTRRNLNASQSSDPDKEDTLKDEKTTIHGSPINTHAPKRPKQEAKSLYELVSKIQKLQSARDSQTNKLVSLPDANITTLIKNVGTLQDQQATLKEKTQAFKGAVQYLNSHAFRAAYSGASGEAKRSQWAYTSEGAAEKDALNLSARLLDEHKKSFDAAETLDEARLDAAIDFCQTSLDLAKQLNKQPEGEQASEHTTAMALLFATSVQNIYRESDNPTFVKKRESVSTSRISRLLSPGKKGSTPEAYNKKIDQLETLRKEAEDLLTPKSAATQAHS